jgi:hypothetical protein
MAYLPPKGRHKHPAPAASLTHPMREVNLTSGLREANPVHLYLYPLLG